MTSPGAAGTAMPPLQFCIPPNPTIGVLREHAQLGLRKLRAGRNISGILRDVPAYSAPTDTTSGMPVISNGQIRLATGRAVPPTAYRYSVLIARVKELAQQAAQIEALYTAALEKRDEASYSRLQASQELTLATADVRLQSLQVNAANDGVKLADLQVQRALIQQQTYQTWIANGLNEYERNMLALYGEQADLQTIQAASSATAQIAQAAATAATAPETGVAAATAAAMVVADAAGTGAMAAAQAAGVASDIQTAALMASQERRLEEWQLQAALSQQDLQIGAQQKTLALDQVAITEQEKTIAETRESQSRDKLEFLANRFTSFELYDWMTGVLADAYRSLLQKAAATLNMARSQLAFERQEDPPITILADYWTAPTSGLANSATTPADDRRGLTGSARLLADLYQLDQYAFDTNKRKLAVTKTISLAQLAPAEFQQFRETGVLVFATPTELFDRDFPGHYLRLIRRVRTSVIALIPPVDGIKATLSNTGISRVVVGPEPFQTVTIRRDPETVALSNPIDATGVFDPDTSEGMYLPFEGNGLDSTWELRLPLPANHFDRITLSDVLVTYEYLCLSNYDYGQAVIKRLAPDVSADLALSVRNSFPDAWYDLNNPDLLDAAARWVLRVEVTAKDCPPNLTNHRLKNIALRFGGDDAAIKSFSVYGIKRTDPSGQVTQANAGAARAVDGNISTRNGSGVLWQRLVGASAAGVRPTPFGTWEINLQSANPADNQALRNALAGGGLSDILIVLTYSADTPPWPE
jgi:hypothetical protein